MAKIFAFLTSRLFIFGLSVLIQLYVFIMVVFYLGQNSVYIYALFNLLSILTILNIISKKDNPIYKLAWVVPVALFPLVGWYLFYLFDRKRVSKDRIERMTFINKTTSKYAPPNEDIINEIKKLDPTAYRHINYIKNVTNLSVYDNTQSEYLCTGEAYFERLCLELEKAEKFIFMEYFIIEEGIMWNTLLDILVRKAQARVEVKLIYDDMGCIQTLPKHYDKYLRKYGIQVHAFNVFTPSFDIFVNYRDHRKITVIDGNIGFTGGCNLADEYINKRERFGKWHDAGIIIKGNAVWSLSVLFLQLWQYYQNDDLTYKNYLPPIINNSDKLGTGYLMPYGDGPLDDHLIGENIYINIINSAKKYVSITTPYLILDNEMITALCLAALSGVQVSIITPSIPDKWYVHLISQYNYTSLVEAGVEIYEFKDGFIHSKTMVADNEYAVVGTQNFDFRSFYLHYECGIYMYKADSILDVRADHLKCMEEGNRISLEECQNKKFHIKALQTIFNLFAPMM